jgi:hypothetical protein
VPSESAVPTGLSLFLRAPGTKVPGYVSAVAPRLQVSVAESFGEP